MQYVAKGAHVRDAHVGAALDFDHLLGVAGGPLGRLAGGLDRRTVQCQSRVRQRRIDVTIESRSA